MRLIEGNGVWNSQGLSWEHCKNPQREYSRGWTPYRRSQKVVNWFGFLMRYFMIFCFQETLQMITRHCDTLPKLFLCSHSRHVNNTSAAFSVLPSISSTCPHSCQALVIRWSRWSTFVTICSAASSCFVQLCSFVRSSSNVVSLSLRIFSTSSN